MLHERTNLTDSRAKPLGLALERLHGLAAAQVYQHMAAVMRNDELSFSHLNALIQLQRFGPQTITDLAKGTRLSHAAASRLVQRLVKQGLANRAEMQDNRRQKQVTLTTAGRAHLNELRQCTAAIYNDLLARVPENLLLDLTAALIRMEPFLPDEPGMLADNA